MILRITLLTSLLCGCASSPVQLSAWPGRQIVESDGNVYGLRTGLIADNEDVYGIDVDLVASFVGRGIGLSAALLHMADDHIGIHVGVMTGAIRTTGISAGLYNGTFTAIAADGHGPMHDGIQISAFNSWAVRARGAQLGVFTNYAERGTGLQVAIGNGSDEWRGLQLGAFNRATESNGLQVGLYNSSDTGGLQIGLLNHKKNGFLPWFPLFNF